MWADARTANAPSGLLGRLVLEPTRTTASDMMGRQAHWPFHLAGDYGARFFTHRAWVCWRVLALLELPSLTFSELPLMSNGLQALIEATRRQSPRCGWPVREPDMPRVFEARRHGEHRAEVCGHHRRWTLLHGVCQPSGLPNERTGPPHQCFVWHNSTHSRLPWYRRVTVVQ